MVRLSNRVTPELRDEILKRDQGCVARLHDPSHRCSGKTTVDHFWHTPGGRKGDRAPSDHLHLVAMCWELNVRGPSRALRAFERWYIAHVYGLDHEALLRGAYE